MLLPLHRSLTLFLGILILSGLTISTVQVEAGPPPSKQPSEIYARLPLHFIPNAGQWDSRIRFLVDARRQSLAFTDAGVEISLGNPGSAKAPALRMRFSGARKGVAVQSGQVGEGRINYLLGSNPSGWRTGLPAYNEVSYADLYPRIDLSYRGQGDELESIFTVKPGGRVRDIRIHCREATSLKLDQEGNLNIATSGGLVRESKPVAFQFVRGVRHEIPIRFWVRAKTYGFRMESAYDETEPLIIDPFLAFSSYLGGSGEDAGTAIAVDGAGQLYITGLTVSTNFPTQSPFRSSAAGKGDVFVTKIAANGSSLIYSTYLGGSDRDVGTAIAINASGEAHVTGLTLSTDFPVVSGFQSTNAGKGDVFVAKLAANGQSLVYSTYLGGDDLDIATGIALDSGGAVFLCGQTFSSSFPVQNPFQATLRGIQDAFAAKLSSSGQTLDYSTYLGGSSGDGANAIAVDSLGQAHLTGFTTSGNFPLQSAFQSAHSGNTDAFVTKIGASGNSLVFSTYLGGSDDDSGNALLVDSTGAAYITGSTRSGDFPTASAYQPTNKGGLDAFLTQLSSAGNSLISSTYLGGSGEDEGFAIARDSAGLLYVAGTTSSANFPLANPLRSSLLGDTDAFVTEFASGALSLVFSTYIGGSVADSAVGMVVDSSAKIYVTGLTRSADFPTVAPKQPGFGGGTTDAYYLQIDPAEPVFATTLYFPRLVTNDGAGSTLDTSEFTGIALANLSATGGATLHFTALDTAGALISGAGIVNPTQVSLGGKAQLAVVDTQVFGAGLAPKKPVGWFKMGSTIADVVGFFLAFNSSLTVLDGADVSTRTATSFILPEVEDLGFTQIHIANPDTSAASVTLELVELNLGVRATAMRNVATNGVLVETVALLFPTISIFNGGMYVRVTSTRPVVAFEYLGRTGQYVEGLNGQDTTQGAMTVYSPQYVVGGPWRTTLSIVNLENTTASVTLELIDDNGAVLGTRVVNISPNGKSQITAQNFFVTPNPSIPTQGYVRLVSDKKIGGAVIFGDPARTTFSAALPLVSKLQSSSVFSQVASDSVYFTGLAVLNPGDAPVSFTLDVFDKTGLLVATKPVSVSAKRRDSHLLTQHFPSLPSMSSGYFRVTAPQGLVSFALFGTNNLSVLSAVPSQAAP